MHNLGLGDFFFCLCVKSPHHIMLYVDLYIFSLVVLIASLPRDISKVSWGHECRRPFATGNIREGQGFQRSGLFRLKWQGRTKTEVATVKKIQCVKCKYKFQDFSNQMCCTAAQSFISCWNLLGKKRTTFQIPLHILSTFSWINLQRSMEIICMQDECLTEVNTPNVSLLMLQSPVY